MELDHMLKALGEPTRLRIYQALLERKHCVRSLSKKFGISESAMPNFFDKERTQCFLSKRAW